MLNMHPLLFHALRMATQSPALMANGFWQKTCFPASNAARTCSLWKQFHEAIMTQSMSGDSHSLR